MFFLRFHKRVPGVTTLIKKLSRFFLFIGVAATIGASSLVLSSLNLLPHNFNHAMNYLSYKFAGDPAHTVDDFSELREVLSKGMSYSLGFNKYPLLDLSLDIDPAEVLKLNSYLELGSTAEIKVSLKYDDHVALPAKVRSKGDRPIHKAGFDNMSFRVNMKGDNSFKGMDKFSIQKPMLRNYTWEFFLSDVARRSGLLTLDMGLIDFYVNGHSRGVYSFEEVPQKEVVERNLRKNGPIFGLDESLGESFPDVVFEVYEKQYWKGDGITLYSAAVNKLEILKNLGNVDNLDQQLINDIFDIDKWAKFFALTDLFGAYHGAILKSVKLYYNPSTGLFEPLLFDAHVGAGRYDSFFLMDYVARLGEVECYPTCNNSDWFKVFFNFQNKDFLAAYKDELTLISSNESLVNLQYNYDENFSQMTDLFYAQLMRSDAIFFEGLSLFHFDFSFLEKRAAKIRSRLNVWSLGSSRGPSSSMLSKTADRFLSDEQLSEMTDFTFVGSELHFDKPTILLLRGSTMLRGLDNTEKLRVTGPVMLVQLGGAIKLKNVEFFGGRSIDVTGTNWSGALNFIDSTVVVEDVVVSSNLSEDAVNSVNSSLTGTQITFQDSFSDALDVDFGTYDLGTVICERVGNDCIDASGAIGSVEIVRGQVVGDKLISAGERANLRFDEVYSESVGIGVVSKDSSTVHLKKLELSNSDLAGSIFIKKSFFGQPSLIIENVRIIEGSGRFLINDSASFLAPADDIEVVVLSSEQIQDLMYGNEYGAKTVK